eukprot:scaffold23858_cov46-Cyclotella_meneghiniana.AAC.1
MLLLSPDVAKIWNESKYIFKYLGCLMSIDNNDIQAVQKNRSKAQRRERQVACGVLNCEVRGSTNTQHDTLTLTDHGRATCLASVDVLEEVGLNESRKPGTSPCLIWLELEQPLSEDFNG